MRSEMEPKNGERVGRVTRAGLSLTGQDRTEQSCSERYGMGWVRTRQNVSEFEDARWIGEVWYKPSQGGTARD